MLPDFLVIGTQKAGTTWLYRNLRAHPEIWMPKEKELHYFDEKAEIPTSIWSRLWGDREMDLRWRRQVKRQLKGYRRDLRLRGYKRSYLPDLGWDLRYFMGRYNDRWYASLFEPGEGKVTGEITPSYGILDGDAVARVHRLMPDAKIVFMMRNPIERVWSAADMGFRLSGLSLEHVPGETLYRDLDNPRARLYSDYRRTLENWGAFYPPEKIFVGFIEDIHLYPEDLLQSLYAFLEIDTSVEYHIVKRKVHAGSTDRMIGKVAAHLARSYSREIGWLDERFGGYASFWSYCANRLSREPPESEFVAHPLYGSHLWEEWVNELGEARIPVGLQSGPLSSNRISP